MEYVVRRREGDALEKHWKKEAKIITSRHMFNVSLKHLCLKAVVRFLQLSPKDFDVRRLSSLPVALKHDLVNMLNIEYCYFCQTEMFRWTNFKRFLLQLMANLSEFTFNYVGQPTDEDKEGSANRMLRVADKEMYQMLAQLCRKSLKVFYHGLEGYDNLIYTDNLKKHPVMMSSLLRLTNLQQLDLNRHMFSDKEFLVLCSNLVNLEQLNCNLVYATWPGISAGLRLLRKLEVFEFKLHCCSESHDDCAEDTPLIHYIHHQCLKEFPQLKVVGDLALEYCTVDRPEGNLCHALDDTTLFGPRPRSQLQQLILRKTITQSQAEWHQNVKSLRITWVSSKFKNYETLLKFKNIENLIFEHQAGALPSSIIMKFFKVYGQKLQTFNLLSKNVLTVEQIVDSCPNLKHLGLTFEDYSISRSFDGFGRPSTLGNITHLTLDWLDVTDRPEVLVQIFTAPNLEYIFLCDLVADGFCLTRALQQLQIEKVIAPQLVGLKLSPLTVYVDHPINNIHVNLRYHWRLFMRFVCSNAPLLKCIKNAMGSEMDMNDIVREFKVRGKYIPLDSIHIRKTF